MSSPLPSSSGPFPVSGPVHDEQDRDRALAHVFTSGELVWILEERYEAPTSSWMITVACQGPQAKWMRRRYRYDSAVDVLFFLGERPLSDEEIANMRRYGKRFNT